MYKSMLQELCQKNKWALPKYTCMKDGPDHLPKYKASVVANGINFDTLSICKSSKEAHNEAAKQAFLYFTSEQHKKHTKKPDIKKEIQRLKVHLGDVASKQLEKPKDEPGLKSPKIDSDAQSLNQDQCKKHTETPDNEKKIQCDKVHPDIAASKQREKPKDEPGLESAKIDSDAQSVKQDSPSGYQKKLQILAERKNLKLEYYTERESPYALFFKATVTIGENCFESQGTYHTVEEAKDAAAQAALLSFYTFPEVKFPDSTLKKEDPHFYKNLVQELTQSRGSFLPTYSTIASGNAHTSVVEVDGEVFMGTAAKSKKLAVLNAAKAAYTALNERELFHPGYPSPQSADRSRLKLAPLMGSMTISDQQKILKTGCSFPTKGQNEEKKDSGTKEMAERKSYLLCSRVIVYVSIPDIALPEGTVILPIGEDKWVLVNLEFPNERKF